MKELVLPRHPRFDIQCKKCSNYLHETAKRIAMDGQFQGQPVAELIAKGINLEAVTVATVGACTEGPTWKTVAEQHWCSRYVATVKS